MHGTHGDAVRVERRDVGQDGTGSRIHYPHEQHPRGAEVIEVAPDILWARVPLPFRLNHVNVWLIREKDGWTLIDTGTANAEARAVWDGLFDTVLSSAPIVRQIATHGHTDHVGLAGWLFDRSGGAPYHITLVEWLAASMRIEESKSSMRPQNQTFLNLHGCDETVVEGFADERRKTNAQMLPLPPAIQRLRDGQKLSFGGRTWEVMVCGGHAAEHASFWCAEDNILIAGDQVLSKISPMIGIYPAEPDADPLTEYLASLDRFRALPADAIVLPSHGLPFTGLHVRVNELASHHALRLGQLEQLMATPGTAMDLARGLFPGPVADGHARHAFSETLAHANHLLQHGRAVRRQNQAGNFVFEPAR